MEELDFKLKVTRSELESMIETLTNRIQNPIKSILEAAKLSISDISSVVLVGGSVRVPAVQSALSALVTEYVIYLSN
jgi:hypoxia up-regulated 1